MFRKGLRLFSAASVLCLLTALLHVLGQLAPPPTDPALARGMEAMRETRLPMPMSPSLMDADDALSWTMAVLLIVLGVQNLILARRAPRPAAVMPYAVLGAGGMLILAALSWRYHLLPPMVTLGLVGLLYAASLGTLGRD